MGPRRWGALSIIAIATIVLCAVLWYVFIAGEPTPALDQGTVAPAPAPAAPAPAPGVAPAPAPAPAPTPAPAPAQ
ncbi:hypothetical protein ACFOYU_20165 [Microvirga sp. GCM10011540]|uniref:hypothetical protein n=1 Tax=Microvirga sp. GCM10011540 TaxID=3317338 RepID=UPI003607D8E8